ncbi:hypothetical protein L3X38_003592 [Prunus dulcis]|uniref:RNase H type-1 domain-containing protein n=1 Tax=Prunus dulcis TaxID=3755 RepID=A0AAD5F254_PRUDU|nr:hypothetical protein L3X38_003592 [Prunus dulcis]
MPGLDRQLVEHKRPIKDGYLPVKQARRRMSMDTELKVKEEIERLLKAGFIRPAIYADWLANIVPVLKRKTGAVRICVDYRNLNEASPKDEYPMPMADMLIDGAAHNQMLSFMDGNAGYNQIMKAEQDIHKTAFMCPGHIGAFEYTVMPFGLRNAGATYQRAMNSIFHDMIGHSLEVYIDDVVIKSPEEGNHVSSLRKAFLRMRHHKLKMNPKKKNSTFFFLSPPKRGRPLKLYVSTSEVSIGSLLVQDNKEGKEQAIYYLSRTLTEVERRYSAIERLCLALYFTAVKLRHYMLPHTIYIIAKTYLIKYMLTRPMLRGRIGKWTLVLTEFTFRYVPQKAVKGQAVADFLADHPGEEIENMDSLDIANANLLTRAHVCLNNPIYSIHLTPWKLYFDGSKTDKASGAGVVLEEPLGVRHCYSFQLDFQCTNNRAEYEALIIGLEMLVELGIQSVEILGDSMLVLKQIAGEYKCLNHSLAVYLVAARNLLTEFREATWEYIPREENCAANELAQVASGIQMPGDCVQRIVKIGRKSLPSVLTRGMEIEVNSALITKDDWREPIMTYLQYPTLPSEKRVRIMATNYLMWNEDLVRKSKDEVLLRCLGKTEYMKSHGRNP